jgi:hypothetical protein
MSKIIEVPQEFRPSHPGAYPEHHTGKRTQDIALEYFSTTESKSDWIYLPIFWNNYFVTHNFGQEVAAMERLVNFYTDTMEKHKGCRVWTLNEYADGILFDVPDLTVFGCGGPGKKATMQTIPIPLLSTDHPVNRSPNPKYKVSFVGSFGTHRCRRKLLEDLGDRPGWILMANVDIKTFEMCMNDSIFALTPRGYGPTSYRLYEAIQMGCIPVYVGDDLWLPYTEEIDWNSFCILSLINEEGYTGKLVTRLESMGLEEIATMRQELSKVHQSHFTMEATVKYIERKLKTL